MRFFVFLTILILFSASVLCFTYSQKDEYQKIIIDNFDDNVINTSLWVNNQEFLFYSNQCRYYCYDFSNHNRFDECVFEEKDNNLHITAMSYYNNRMENGNN